VAPALRERTGAPVMLHPDDRPLWELTHGGPEDVHATLWDLDLEDGLEIEVGGTTLRVLHTPGHAPGAVCLHAPDLGCVFTGDTLFQDGPGATGGSSRCRTRPWCTPGTATTRRSARRGRPSGPDRQRSRAASRKVPRIGTEGPPG
jgi:glyoxylase-like metal-dependent hydrolase (beta-lactamase superfamily II)